MSTVNIVLMVILSVMIGFAIGNVYGRETMKKTFSGLMETLTKALKAESEKMNAEKKKEE